MRVREFETDGVFVVEVDDALNERDAAVATAIEGALDGARVVVMDCAGLAEISSAGVGNILRLKTRMGLKGATLRLAALSPLVEGVLRKARADQVVEIFDTVNTAAARRVRAGL